MTANSNLSANARRNWVYRERHQVNLLAISRTGKRITQRLRSVRFQAGDVVVLQGRFEVLPEALKELRLSCRSPNGISASDAAAGRLDAGCGSRR